MCSRTSLLLGVALASAAAAAAQQIDAAADVASWAGGPAGVLLLPEEHELLRSVDDVERARQFIDWFWQRRDPQPATAINEFRQQWHDRLSFAEREFGEPGRPGWSTARGQLYLLLGPPDGIGDTRRRYRVGSVMRTLIAWVYAGGRPGDPSLTYLFAATAEGVKLVAEAGPARMRPDQQARIDEARRRLVHDSSLPSFARVVEHAAELLPLQGHAGHDQGGVLAEIRVRIQDLYGEPHGDALRYRLEVGLGTVVSAGSNPGNAVVFDFAPAEVAEWADQPLRLVVWLPAAAAADTVLRVHEPLTGRDAFVRIAADSALPTEFFIARQLAVTELAGGAGVAVAYFPTCALRHPVAVARLLAGRLALLQAPSAPLAGGRMALLPQVPVPR